METPRLVVAGGGSPCQGLSLLSTQRQHFKDERSQLFYDMADRLNDLKALCAERNIQFLGLVENVMMDEKDRDEITERLGWRPHLAQSGDISRVRRVRFYWLSHDVPSMPLEIQPYALMTKVTLHGEMEPDAVWLPEGLNWNGGELPTFIRPIKRSRPPIDPAGLKDASVGAKHRWREDHFRFPPYVYEETFLLATDEGQLKKVPAYSKELLMGFKADHTKKLDRELFKSASVNEEKDIRQAALGNSFHTTTVAALLGAILFEMKFLAEP